MRINHNIAALNTYRQLNSASGAQAKSMEKLSSGLRINKAGDDAAGLAISEKMRSQIRGLDMASKNAQDGVSLIQTAEGALNETHSILQRMRELAVQASNDTNTSDDRGEIQKEINQLTSEINRIGNTTEFNTKKLLNGDFEKIEASSANIQGTSVASTITLSSTPTNGTATGTVLGGAVEIHNGKGGSAVGNVDVHNGGSGVTVTEADNELTLKVDGEEITVSIAAQAYADGDAFAAALQSAINTATSGTDVTVASDTAGTGALSITSNSKGTSSTVEIIGGGLATTWLSTANDMSDITENAGKAANNSLSINIDGTTHTVSLTTGTYANTAALAAQLNTDIDTAIGSDVADVNDATGALEIVSKSTGSSSSISAISGAAAQDLGLTNVNYANGQDRTDQVALKVDGEDVSFTLATGAAYDANVLAATLQSQINNATSTAADVTVSYQDGKFTITSGAEGDAGSVTLTDNGFAATVGLSTSNGAVVNEGQDEANASLKFQIGANQGQSMDIVIGDMRGLNLGITADTDNATKVLKDSEGEDVTVSYTTGTANVTNGTNNTGVEFALDVSSAEKASAAILALDESIASVSAERSRLGSYQNRLEHTINNLGTSSENLTAAESRIRDVDMAKEMMDQTKASILSQASQAMLAQANQMPQGVLQLLR